MTPICHPSASGSFGQDQKMGVIDTAVLWPCSLLCAGWCLVGCLFQVTNPGPAWVAGVSEGLPWPRALNK